MLSGTPIINNPIEIAYTINLLRGEQKTYSVELSGMPYDYDIRNKLKYVDMFSMKALKKNILLIFTIVPNDYKVQNGKLILKNKSDRVVSIHRSVQMSRPDTIATNFANWVRRDKDKIMPYHIKNLLSDHDGSTYLLSFGNKPDLSIFENCIDHLFLKKNNVGRHVGRNPFNDSSPYHGYLFKLKDLKKTNCYKN